MLNNEDIQKIIKAEQGIFATKNDLENFREEMRNNFSELLTSVDGYNKKAETFFQELIMTSHKIERHEKWIHQIAKKLGVKLEY